MKRYSRAGCFRFAKVSNLSADFSCRAQGRFPHSYVPLFARRCASLLDRGPCQVKRYSLRSQQFCQHILRVEQSEGAFVWIFCALVCVALCVIAKYKTTLYKFNWLKDKLPCLDSPASPADQAHHAVRAVRVKICVKTSCRR